MPRELQISGPIARQPVSPSLLQQFRSNPTRFVADRFYASQPPIAPTLPRSQLNDFNPSSHQTRLANCDAGSITVVCISDTHNATPASIPDGDILLHAGDLTNKGTFSELQAQHDWLNTLPHDHKVVIAGNHDALLDEAFVTQHPERFAPEEIARRTKLNWGQITYLNCASATLMIRNRSITIFGSPSTPECGTFAFQHLPIRNVWRGVIADATDIVLTHGPPKGHLDGGGKGCEWLLRELWRTKPRAVVFGHIHAGRGREDVCWDGLQKGYDFVGPLNLLVMGFALGWSFLRNVFGVARTGRTAFVNAAIEDYDGPAVVLLV